jgi:hypothetical protein
MAAKKRAATKTAKKKVDEKPAMAIGAALTRMAASARKFDTSDVRERDLAVVAAMSGGSE